MFIHRVLKYSECFTRCRNFYSILQLSPNSVSHNALQTCPPSELNHHHPSPLTYEKMDKGLVVLFEAAALLSVFFFFHLILNNILHDIQALHSRATIYNSSPRQASERITVAPAGQRNPGNPQGWMLFWERRKISAYRKLKQTNHNTK